MKINIYKNEIEGFTIVETLITLLAITLMLAGPLVFMYRSYSYSQIIKVKVIANGLSQEGLELATSLRNKSLSNFKSVADSTACKTGCTVDWDGISSTPTFSSSACDITGTTNSCRLSTTTTSSFGVSSGQYTDFYRYIKFTANGTQSYTVESIVWSDVNGIKVLVNLKKTIFNLTIK